MRRRAAILPILVLAAVFILAHQSELSAVQDGYVSAAAPSASYGNADSLSAASGGLTSCAPSEVSYLRFDLGGLAEGPVRDAALVLETTYAAGGNSGNLVLYAAPDTLAGEGNTLAGGGLTWSNRPGLAGMARLASVAVPVSAGAVRLESRALAALGESGRRRSAAPGQATTCSAWRYRLKTVPGRTASCALRRRNTAMLLPRRWCSRRPCSISCPSCAKGTPPPVVNPSGGKLPRLPELFLTIPSKNVSLLRMASPSLLATKLRIPPQPQWTVARVALLETLEEKVPLHRLTLVTAPAGYGKTTLASEWAQQSVLPVAWLSLGEGENHLERFLRYLFAAWKEVDPGVAESTLGVLLGGQMPEKDSVLAAFTNVGSKRDEHLVFVLDDFHLIDEPSVLAALAFLLDHLPPALHFVLCGRGEPALPLARYRARRQLLEIRAEDLRFSRDEARAFLDHFMGPVLGREDADGLQQQTGGWIAGLQLAALSLRHHNERLADRPVVSGRQRFIADYLSDDVLAPLPQTMREFLLQTSILERLCAPLCAAVTGYKASQAMLEKLEGESLFLTPLDDSRKWFRYHPLFAEFLQARLEQRNPEEVKTLHRVAARWHLDEELPEQAFEHAVAGDDAGCAIEVIERYLGIKLTGGEFRQVQAWLDALPEQWLVDYPVINVARAALFAYTGAVEQCIRCLDDAEERIVQSGEETRAQRARITAMRCFVACFQNDLAQAERLAARALRDLPEENQSFRPGVYGALGDTYRRHGRWEEARQWYLKALELAHAPVVRFQAGHVFGALADLALRQGRLHIANDFWAKALASVAEQAYQPTLPLPAIGWLYIRRGEILYEWNQLASAREHLSQGLERAELGGDRRAMIAGYLLIARLALTEGDSEQAGAYLEQPLVENASPVDKRLRATPDGAVVGKDGLRAAIGWAGEMLAAAA